MKKALTISIRSTLFTIEEDAYNRLDAYLKDITAHFSKTEGSEDVVSDIETRIAEKLLETKEQVISLPSVETIISVMGNVDQFEETKTENTSAKTSRTKKLYRNPSDALIGGVASGIAAYIGQDVLFVRLGFVILTFLSGFGVLLYVTLWILTPEAKTQAQKLEMAGEPVTLETISTAVKEQIRKAEHIDTKKAESAVRSFIQSASKSIGPVARITIAIVLILIGVSLIGGAFAALTLIASISAGFPLLGSYILGMGTILLSIIIPGVCIFLAGIGIIRKKPAFSASFGIAMLTMWAIAICVTLVMAARFAGGYIFNPDVHQFQNNQIPQMRVIQIRHW